jgi:hypothetical protein
MIAFIVDRPRLIVALVLLLIATTAQSQPCKGERIGPRGDGMPVMGLRIGTPQIVSFYTGPTWLVDGPGKSCLRYQQVFVEPGLGGGQVGVAYGYGRGLAGDYLMGRLQASVLRTWGPSWHAPRAWFGGGELQVTRGIGLHAGYFRGIRRGKFNGPEILTISFALGY